MRGARRGETGFELRESHPHEVGFRGGPNLDIVPWVQ